MATVLLLFGGLLAFKWLKDNTTLSFSFVLDGQPLPLGTASAIQVDGQPFTSGCTIAPGRHKLTADLQIAEVFVRQVWVFAGSKDLGELRLEPAKGSLLVSVAPSPAAVTVRHGADVMGQGAAPLVVERLTLGDYELEVTRGEVKEVHHVKIEGRSRTEAKIALALGSLNLSSEPADAEFRLSGKGRQWEGTLPRRIDDVPVGVYVFTARRKGGEVSSTLVLDRGRTEACKVDFAYGSIEVSSDPDGLAVSINGEAKGKTPMTLRDVIPGEYKLVATDGQNDLSIDVNVGKRDVVKHAFVFRYGTVKFASSPPGAAVICSGKEVGKTPLTLDRMPAGQTTVVLRLDGYQTTNPTMLVEEGKTVSVTAKLINERYAQSMKYAQEKFDAKEFEEAMKHVAAALETEPGDPTAGKLRDEIAAATRKAVEERATAERIRKDEMAAATLKAAEERATAERVRKETEEQGKREEITKVLEKAITASGGTEAINRLRAVKRVTSVTKSSLIDRGGRYVTSFTTYMQFPDRYRLDQDINTAMPKFAPVKISIPPSRATYCVTEREAWSNVGGLGDLLGHPPVKESMKQRLRNDLYFAECATVVPLLGPEYTLESYEGTTPADSVAIKVHRVDKPEVTMFFDLNKGWLVRLDSKTVDESGRLLDCSYRYSRYHRFSDLMYAMVVEYTEGENVYTTVEVKSLEPLSRDSTVFNAPTRR